MLPESSHEPGLAGRNRAATAFHRDRMAFLCRTGQGGAGVGASHSADELDRFYTADIVWKAAIQYVKHLWKIQT